jgi:5-methylcytosine-specific restriction endonuclease McrA
MTEVLLLNSSFEPLNVIALRRAIRLLLAGKVEIVEVDEQRPLRTASGTHVRPLVLRLRVYRNVPRRGVTWSSRGVFVRDNWTCGYCGCKLNKSEATVDHIIPQAQCKRHGIKANTWANTICACQHCNNRKGGRPAHDAGMKLLWEPRTPRTKATLVASGNIPEEWRKYIEW